MDWIRVKDRLPEYTATYIVYCNIGSILGGLSDVRAYRFERIGGCDPKWVIPNSFDEVVCVTHWQPLPQPPKED